MPVKIVRPFNTFGPRQSARAIIPTVITQILNGNQKVKVGNTTPTRDLTYVKDTVNGFIEIAKADKLTGQVTNIGMNDEISVEKLIRLIAKLMNNHVEIVQQDNRIRPSKSEVERLKCDNSKIISSTNWKPSYTLEMGLKETIDWLQKNSNFYKPELYNL